MVMLMKGRNSRERLSQSDGRTTRAAAGSLTRSTNHGTMKLQHQRSVTNADDDLAQLRVCKRLTRRASLSAALLLRCNFWRYLTLEEQGLGKRRRDRPEGDGPPRGRLPPHIPQLVVIDGLEFRAVPYRLSGAALPRSHPAQGAPLHPSGATAATAVGWRGPAQGTPSSSTTSASRSHNLLDRGQRPARVANVRVCLPRPPPRAAHALLLRLSLQRGPLSPSLLPHVPCSSHKRS